MIMTDPLQRLLGWIRGEPRAAPVYEESLRRLEQMAGIAQPQPGRAGNIDEPLELDPPLINVPVSRADIEQARLVLSDATREDGRRIYLTYAERDRLARLITRLWEESAPWPRENL